MADHPGHEAVVPDVVLAGSHVQVPGDHQGRRRIAAGHLAGQPFEEVQLVVELGIDRPVRDVAAGGDVEVVDLHARDLGRDAAGVALAANVQRRSGLQRQARGDGHPVPTLLALDLQVRQAHVGEGLDGELALPALDLLQAQDVGGLFGHEAGDMIGAKAHRIDVPGAEAKAHRPNIGVSCARRLRLESPASAPGPQEKRPASNRRPGVEGGLSCRRREGIGSGTVSVGRVPSAVCY